MQPTAPPPDAPTRRGGRRHPLVTLVYVLGTLAVLALVAGAVAGLVHLASTARETAASSEVRAACDPSDDPADTRNLCLYPDRADIQPDDHEAVVGAAVRMSGYTATLDEAFMNELILEDQLTLRITIANRDDGAQPYGPLDWKVQTDDGRTLTPSLNVRDDVLLAGELEPGDAATGTITYDLPPGDYYVVFRPDILNEARGVWRIEVAPPD
jgi:hypothetical protein